LIDHRGQSWCWCGVREGFHWGKRDHSAKTTRHPTREGKLKTNSRQGSVHLSRGGVLKGKRRSILLLKKSVFISKKGSPLYDKGKEKGHKGKTPRKFPPSEHRGAARKRKGNPGEVSSPSRVSSREKDDAFKRSYALID